MNTLMKAIDYATINLDQLMAALSQHLLLVGMPMAIGLGLGLPLGFLSSRSRSASTILINSFNALRVIPSLAILFVAIPYFGLTFTSAAIALTLLVMPPILISTDVAFRSIEPTVQEAAKGMGMTPRQVIQQVEIPLALPVMIAGIKTATVEVIASATLAAFIGAGGLGSFIVLGFALYDKAILLVGAIPVALLALIAEVSLSVLQRSLQPPTAKSLIVQNASEKRYINLT
ncbi:ABC transporter permease [Allocoleopsis franciscana]|uniref:ABC-type proline/glycine betaine transport system, permease component n=1 Tax=Allocoleopsis franciscana PCC 7113 TaxID=1173027 RepID=K9WH30_9CYAN|nr:ABC transporter permease [Allocoleopsis franciscana]AFZ19720.1 ABC-type proline/glycine betaine transport system, permease component [Allocoleopsis franciscana PCC 7113]